MYTLHRKFAFVVQVKSFGAVVSKMVGNAKRNQLFRDNRGLSHPQVPSDTSYGCWSAAVGNV